MKTVLFAALLVLLAGCATPPTENPPTTAPENNTPAQDQPLTEPTPGPVSEPVKDEPEIPTSLNFTEKSWHVRDARPITFLRFGEQRLGVNVTVTNHDLMARKFMNSSESAVLVVNGERYGSDRYVFNTAGEIDFSNLRANETRTYLFFFDAQDLAYPGVFTLKGHHVQLDPSQVEHTSLHIE